MQILYIVIYSYTSVCITELLTLGTSARQEWAKEGISKKRRRKNLFGVTLTENVKLKILFMLLL